MCRRATLKFYPRGLIRVFVCASWGHDHIHRKDNESFLQTLSDDNDKYKKGLLERMLQYVPVSYRLVYTLVRPDSTRVQGLLAEDLASLYFLS